MLSWTKVVVLQWLATTSPDHTLTIHRQYCHFDMFNYLKNGTAILKPNIAIGPVKGPKYHFKFSSFKCLAGKWLDSSNVLTVQGNWGSLERKATFGEILIVLMIDRDFCWGWQRLVLVIEMMICNETFHHEKKSRVTIEVDERYSSIPAPSWAQRSEKSEHMVSWWLFHWPSICDDGSDYWSSVLVDIYM